MSEQMQEVIGQAIAKAYESGEVHQRRKINIVLDALLEDAERRLLEIKRSPSYLMQLHATRTEIRIYKELKERVNEQAR